MLRVAKWAGGAVVLLVVPLMIFVILLPGVLSSRLVIVYSGSMEPELPMGSLAVITQVDPAAIQKGDVITFRSPEEGVNVSHRVVAVSPSAPLTFKTKGDANSAADPFIVPAESVVGRVTGSVPNVGYVLGRMADVFTRPWGLVLLIALPSLVVLGSAVRDANFMYSPSKRRARQRKKIADRQKKRRRHN
ncbi:MAG: signal peptidase I [Dehalococcoidales bacterium]|nr:MAG: signal peptidase I [Dehalococcoidales bacterium]